MTALKVRNNIVGHCYASNNLGYTIFETTRKYPNSLYFKQYYNTLFSVYP